LSKICATDLAIPALSSKEDQTGYPASKAVLAQAVLTIANSAWTRILGNLKNCLTGVEALLLLAACRNFRFPQPSRVTVQMASCPVNFFSTNLQKTTSTRITDTIEIGNTVLEKTFSTVVIGRYCIVHK
jgi:hypothetical protein